MRKVLFGTPTYDGKVHVEFLQSLIHTISLTSQAEIALYPVQICGDALVQRARNDLISMAIETECDDIVFMDSDQEWNPEWVLSMLNHAADVVGGVVVKKSNTPGFNVKLLPSGATLEKNGLMEVECIGTGFLRISKRAMNAVWDISQEYKNDNKKIARMVFDVQIINGDLVSEDNVFCKKWRSLGEKVYIDPNITCNHIGSHKWSGNFLEYLTAVQTQSKLTDTSETQ
jgi:glycosyltransferase involved in cell wall biosynthesis